MLFRTFTVTAALALLTFSAADAKVSSSDAAALGQALTPIGAERAGNADGTIPEWTGGLTSAPPSYQAGRHHTDPFADDAVEFTIDGSNYQQYADKLTPGQQAMFARYPNTWKMPVYPTRRSASYPEWVYEAAISNATNAELAAGGNGVANATGPYPFVIPQNGNEVIWNHLMRYRGGGVERVTSQVAPTPTGSYTEVKIAEQLLYNFAQPGASTESLDNILAYFLQEVQAPARLAGTLLLVHETIDQIQQPRSAWTYNPGQRRVRRAPNVAYDNPGTASDGQRTNDQLDMFNGAPDRYNWELVGKKEIYIPYNNYRLHSGDLSHADIIQPGHINPDLGRYELHRVWVVDATIKDGTSHVYGRRTFYFDEDSWQIVLVDIYDSRGEMWRPSEAYTINYYDGPFIWETLFSVYDLQNGRYLANGLNNEFAADKFTDLNLSSSNFTPNALRRKGRR